MANRRDVDIFGTNPYGLTSTGQGAWGGSVPDPALPSFRPDQGARGGTGTRNVMDYTPAPPSAPPATPPPTGTTTGTQAFSQPALWSYLQQFPHTPQGLQQAYTTNPAMFGGATIFGSKGDKLRLPTGQVIDLIQSAGTGGTGWQWLDESAGGGGGAHMGFTDPTQTFLLDAVGKRLAELEAAKKNAPSLDDITKLVNSAVGQWSGPQVQPESMTAAIQALSRMLGEAKPENAQLNTVTGNLRTRIGQLREAPYSQGDEAALRASAFDSLEKDRTATKARVLEELGAKGHAATSGIVARALQEVDKTFDGLRAKNTNQLALSEMSLRESRGSAADQLELALANLGGIDQQAEMQWKQAQLAAGVNAANLDLLWQQEANRRLQAAISAQTSLTGLKQNEWIAKNALGGQQFDVSQTPYSMSLSSLGAANNTLNGQTSLTQVLQALSGLSGMQSNQNQFNSNQNAAYLQGLMGLIGALYGGQNG